MFKMELRVPLLIPYHLALDLDEPWLEISRTYWYYLLAGTRPDFNRFYLISSLVLDLPKTDMWVSL